MNSNIIYNSARTQFILSTFILLFSFYGCEKKVNVSDEKLGDGLLDKIDVEFEDEYSKVEFVYTWDDLGRLSSVEYLLFTKWTESCGNYEITYPGDIEINLKDNAWCTDYYRTSRIFHHSGMVDSILSVQENPHSGISESKTYYQHLEDKILSITTTVIKHNGQVFIDTSVWNLDQHGMITSHSSKYNGQERTFEYSFDSSKNPLENSFFQFLPMSSGIKPILIPYNQTASNDLTASYQYLSNNLPKECIIDGRNYQYSY